MQTSFLRLLTLCSLTLAPGILLAEPAAARPNILYIMSDDHAAHAVSAYGSKVNQTPNIDRIGRAGLRFDNCFAVNSICTPSRAAILTGKYSHKNGVPVFNKFDGSQPTLAKCLQQAGYHTGVIGKWHLGSDPTGFDYWNILPGQGRYVDPEFIDRGGRKAIKGYVTDIIADLSIEFLEKRPKDKPFFLMCHHKAPHREWTPDAKHAKQFEEVEIPEPATFRDDYAGRADAAREATMTVDRHLTRFDLKVQPPADLKGTALQQWRSGVDLEMEVTIKGQKQKLSGEALKKWKYQKYMRDYLACVASVDDNVGRLLDFLDKTGLSKNTIVIYTSDQGFFLGDHNWFDKRFMYEESIRMPFLIRYPGQIKPSTTADAMVLNVDFAPTLLQVGGLPVPADMQGRSFFPILRGETPKDWRTSFYYRYYDYPGAHRVQPHYGVRTTTRKLVYFNKLDQWELYDLLKDPQELHNIIAESQYAADVKQLKAELTRLRQSLDDRDQFANLAE
jgi:arylsulfatase A-like enzyme